MSTINKKPSSIIRTFFLIILILMIVSVIPTLITTINNLNGSIGSIAVIASCSLILIFMKYPSLSKYFKSKKWMYRTYLVLKTIFICGCSFACVISVLIIGAINNKTDDTNVTVVVMGCQVQGTQPSQMLARRLDTAFEFLSEHENVMCIVSGGMGSDEIMPEADVMKRYLVDRGIKAERIITETQSVDTQTNIKFSADIIDENNLSRKVLIVTDSFHQYRSHFYTKQYNLDAFSLNANTPIQFYAGFFAREIFAISEALFL